MHRQPLALAGVHADALAPLLLPEELRLSPEQCAAVCAANPQAVLELTADGQLIHMTPTGGVTGARNQTPGALRQKMATDQANGARLGWLLIPHLQAVEIWTAAGQSEPQVIHPAKQLDAGPLFPGLLLAGAWAPCGFTSPRTA